MLIGPQFTAFGQMHSKKQLYLGTLIDVSNKKGRVGRKPRSWDEEYLNSIPQKKRTTIRQFAAAIEVSPSCIVEMLKRGIIRSHTNNINPSLKTHHKQARLMWIMGKIIPKSVRTGARFDCLFNVIHIDEKWFLHSRVTQRYYLLADEDEPYKHTQHKKFIPKAMFLAALARPIITKEGVCLFDGKIGIWPFMDYVVAQRTTAN